METSPPSPPDRETLTVRYWAGARAAAGVPADTVAVTESTLVSSVIADLAALRPALVPVLPACSLLLDGLRVEPDALVAGAETLEVLPPFAGG